MEGAEPALSHSGAGTSAPQSPPSPGTSRVEQSLWAVGRGSVISLVGSTSQLLLTFVAYVIAVRILSIAAWGEYTLGISVTGLLSLVGLLGLGQAVARSLAYETDHAERRAVVRWGLGVSTVAAVALSTTVFFSARPLADLFHNPALVPVFELMSVTVGFSILSTTIAGIFQGFKDVVPNALISNAINAGLFAVFLFIAIRVGVGIIGVVLAYVLAGAVALALMVAYTWSYLPRHLRLDIPANPRPRRTLWQYSFAFWGTNNFMFITAYADTLILGAFWPSAQVGYYSAAMTLARILLFGTIALAFIFLPVTAGLIRDGDTAAIRTTYLASTRWVLVVSVPFLLLFVFAPNASMTFVWGHRYLPGATALQVLVITSFLASMLGPVQSCLAGLGEARLLVIIASVSAGVNVALSLSLIPLYGVIGAAVAWGVARATMPIVGLGTLWRSYGITPFRRVLLMPLGLALVLGAPVVVLTTYVDHSPWMVVPLFFFGAALYVLCILGTRTLTRDDLALLGSVERILGRPLPELRRFLSRFVDETPPAPARALP